MSGWGCPHEIGGKCMRIKGFECDPGMKGCILFGRFRFSNDAKNRSAKTLQSPDRALDAAKPPRPSSS